MHLLKTFSNVFFTFFRGQTDHNTVQHAKQHGLCSLNKLIFLFCHKNAMEQAFQDTFLYKFVQGLA